MNRCMSVVYVLLVLALYVCKCDFVLLGVLLQKFCVAGPVLRTSCTRFERCAEISVFNCTVSNVINGLKFCCLYFCDGFFPKSDLDVCMTYL